MYRHHSLRRRSDCGLVTNARGEAVDPHLKVCPVRSDERREASECMLRAAQACGGAPVV
jgi:hypothetical protein